jgi:hypothetical protein
MVMIKLHCRDYWSKLTEEEPLPEIEDGRRIKAQFFQQKNKSFR